MAASLPNGLNQPRSSTIKKIAKYQRNNGHNKIQAKKQRKFNVS